MALQVARGTSAQGIHTAGIYADMTVDGPEIGTLVVVVDRAKNLPNRKTMGKQDPYCAARLGKEAKKTETDKRGGQTPKWDQELRFTVHESPDYQNLKLSVFNDDKKTDLIGETWISLIEVLQPGGGQGDQWHSLNCKGRYAGEIRIELTYYDSRPKADRSRDQERNRSQASRLLQNPDSLIIGSRQSVGVRRRPLPIDPTLQSSSSSPAPENANNTPRLGSGLRSYRIPPRQHSASENQRQPRSDRSSYHNSRNSDVMSIPLPTPSATSRSLPFPLENFSSQQQSLGTHVGDSNPSTDQNRFSEYPEDYPEDRYFQEPEFADDVDFDMSVTDDPYALQAVGAYQDVREDHEAIQQIPQPQNSRVLVLSGTPFIRPLPDMPLTHTHSAPMLGPHEQVPQAEHAYGVSHKREQDFDDYGRSPTRDNIAHSSPRHAQGYDSGSWSPVRHGFLDLPEGHDNPPLPPTHRNSSPAVVGLTTRHTPAQHSSIPTRALHIPTSATEASHQLSFTRSRSQDAQLRHSYSGSSVQPQYNRNESPYDLQNTRRQQQAIDASDSHYGRSYSNNVHGHSRSPEAPTSVYPSDTRRTVGHASVLVDSSQPPNVYSSQSRPSPQQFPQSNPPLANEAAHRRPNEIPPLIKPHAVSPRPNHGTHSPLHFPPSTTHRKSVSPHPSPERSQASVPYSPDSFSAFNPQHSNVSTPLSNTPLKYREPSPMYSSHHTPTLSQGRSTDISSQDAVDGPIFGSDGRVKDPTDHLPPSSYAPEPERKGRPSTVVTVRTANRFGPRQAPPAPVTTRPLATSSSNTSKAYGSSPQQQVQRLPQPQQGPSSPLAPADDGALNEGFGSPWVATTSAQGGYVGQGHGFGYDRVEMFAPPVPAKVPLDGEKVGWGGGGTGNAGDMGTLARGVADMAVAGGAGPESPGGGRGLFGRVRKSRFGA